MRVLAYRPLHADATERFPSALSSATHENTLNLPLGALLFLSSWSLFPLFPPDRELLPQRRVRLPRRQAFC
jgi:hypothetical protein